MRSAVRVSLGPPYSLVAMAKGSHLFPSRTQKLSSSAPMVLGFIPGRVGRRQAGRQPCLAVFKRMINKVVVFSQAFWMLIYSVIASMQAARAKKKQ